MTLITQTGKKSFLARNITGATGNSESDKSGRYDGFINLKNSTHKAKIIDSEVNKISEKSPIYIVIGHELIHTWHMATGSYVFKGKLDTNPITGTKIPIGELNTIGIKGSSEYTENKLREENGLPKRVDHKY